jgi:folate-binding protein YgfZ
MVPRDPRAGSFFDLSERTKLRLIGGDRIRFFNGQITNDVRKANNETAIQACVLTAKGKMNAHLFLSVHDDYILIDADRQLEDALASRLERYVISDDVQIENITDQYSLFHFLTENEPSVSGSFISVSRFGLTGRDLWVPATQHDETKQVGSAALAFCDDTCEEVFRIEQGIPAWGRELTEDTIPVEANLEQSCIDYVKGCYIGQEVISRMKMSGQRNKGLYGLTTGDGPPVSTEMKLYPIGEEREAGWITSATWSDRLGKNIALGYVKRPFNNPGAQLNARAGEETVAVKIVNLPFKSDG